MQISLTYRQKKTLESRHKMCRDKNDRDTIKAILLSDKGWSEEMMSHALRKHQTAINRYLYPCDAKMLCHMSICV